MQAYSRQEIDDIKYVAALGEPWEEHELDLTEDRQWQFLMRQIERSGITDETHPEYLKALRAGRDAAQERGGLAPRQETAQAAAGMQDANTVTAFGVNNAHTQSLGAAYSAIVNGTVFTSLYAQLIDTSDDKVLGEKSSGPVYGEGEYLPIDLTGLAPNAEDLLMVFTWTYQRTPGAPITAGSMRVSTAELPVGAPNVTEPLRTKTGNYIKIGLGRPSGAPDCDYWYNEPNIQQPNIRLPLKVTQKFKSAIKQPLWPSNITNPPVISLAKPSTGGVTVPISSAAIQAGITASGDTLTFNFPFNNNVAQDGSIQFGPAAWANDTTLLATIALGVKTETSNNEFVWVTLYTPPAPPYGTSPETPGIYFMWPLYYTWHCVAGGTQVALEDGGTKAIEDIVGGERVRTPRGAYTVVDTFGTNKEDEVLTIHTDDGRELVITHMHPVLTGEGLVAARDLVEGDELVTEDGTARVARVEKRHYSGMVYCIGLGVNPELTDDTFFFANGIAIGDNLACVAYLQKYQKRLKTVLARIPEAFHPEAERSYAARYGTNG